jgi:CRISPR-associated exonuclease Cas4
MGDLIWVGAGLLLALGLWLWARRLRAGSGLPAGAVVYSDTRAWGRVARTLVDRELGLAGRPDYVVKHRDGWVPIEVKSGPAPRLGGHPGHVLQLAAYCALIQAEYGVRPRHGLIQYSDKLLHIPYTPALERELERAVRVMHRARQGRPARRSHEQTGRCRACGFYEVCDQRLGS